MAGDFQSNRRARFVRLKLGRFTTLTIGTSNTTHQVSAKCVAFVVFNYGAADMFMRTDGVAPTTSVGYPVKAGTDCGWIDCNGQVSIELISGTAGQRAEVFEILDEQ